MSESDSQAAPKTAAPTQRDKRLQQATTLVTAVLLVAGVGRAWSLRWVCDDAFISFRYADNLAAGHGLVWNAGERVEGYTNLLWTLLLSIGSLLRLDLVPFSEVLGIISLVVAALATWRIAARWNATPVVIPVAAWILLSMEDVAIWATGGLETMTATAFVAVMALLLFGEREPSARREIAAGVVGGLLALTRADGALLSGIMASGYVIVRWQGLTPALRHGARAVGPVAIAVVGNVAFRLAYYDDWLPNTFYAKSAADPYWAQGLIYLGVMIGRNHVLVWAAVVALGMEFVERRAARLGRAFPLGAADRASAVLAVTGLVFMLYVAYTGGDFMAARRLIPVLPLFLIPFGRLLERLQSIKWQLIVSVALAAASALPLPVFHMFGDGKRLYQVADERYFYPDGTIALRRKQGEALGRAFRGIDTYLTMDGGLCVLAYYSELPRFMEANGLTNRVTAKQEVTDRGLPGHEKPPPEWLLDQLQVTFAVMQSPPRDRTDFDLLTIDGTLVFLKLVYWDEDVMAALRHRPGVRFMPMERQVARLKRDLQSASCAEARSMFGRLDRYYLRWHQAESDLRRELSELAEARCAP